MARDFEFDADFDEQLHSMVEHQVIRPWAEAVREDAQRGAPHESGDLAGDVEVVVLDWDHARIGSDQEYAAATEVGAHPHTIPKPDGRQVHHPGVAAQPYLRPALYREREL
ncbi:hypothetical protein [Micromonospora sp. NBC_00421]|uniref:hypothetical protein n=1 Tax=Micromonospora sp. NBC_00421 TaxID=2975976 RepID=UPI002E247939